jgi:hypothetical protein
MTTTRPSKQIIPPVVSIDWNLHVKDCSSQIKERSLYQKETHVCRYKKTLYEFKQLNAEYLIYTAEVWQKPSMTELVYQNGYSEVRDDGLLINEKLS